MKYMLMMNGTKANFDSFQTWPEEAIKEHMRFMHRFNQELKDSGNFASAEGLAWPNQAKVVRAQGGGGPAITDGPFPEAKEFLAGYWIVDVETPEQAYAIAARASAAPGPDGKPLNIPIEVRQVMAGPPADV